MGEELRRGASEHEEPFIYLSEVALTLGRRFGISELLELFEQLEDVDAARAVVFAVAEQEATAAPVQAFLAKAVNDRREFVAAEAIDGLTVATRPLDDRTIERLLQHPSPYVRGALLRYLARTRGREVIAVLIEALRDPSHLIRENAIDELEELEVREAVPALRRLLNDCHSDVREAARYALQALADD